VPRKSHGAGPQGLLLTSGRTSLVQYKGCARSSNARVTSLWGSTTVTRWKRRPLIRRAAVRRLNTMLPTRRSMRL